MRKGLLVLLLCLALIFAIRSHGRAASFQGVQAFAWTNLTEMVAPSTPSAGLLRCYAGTDHAYHILDSTGTDTTLGATGLGYSLVFGGQMNTAGYYYMANGTSSSVQLASSTVQTRLIVPSAGTITAVSWLSSTADATTDLKIWIDGGSSTKLDLTGATGIITGLSVAVSAGSYIEIEFDANTAPSYGTCTVYITP